MITTEFLASAMQIVLAALRSTTACASTLGCLIWNNAVIWLSLQMIVVILAGPFVASLLAWTWALRNIFIQRGSRRCAAPSCCCLTCTFSQTLLIFLFWLKHCRRGIGFLLKICFGASLIFLVAFIDLKYNQNYSTWQFFVYESKSKGQWKDLS